MKDNTLVRFFVPLLKNKFLLTLFGFFLWITFIDSDNLIDRSRNIRQVHELEREKMYYEQKIEADRQKLKELESSQDNLEKFAREQYHMKKSDEDIFIIEK